MNGEFKELYNKLSKDLAVLEAKQEERWKNHKEQATESRKRSASEFTKIDKILISLSKYFANLPCAVNAEKMENIEESLNALKNNDLRHLNMRINILLFSVMGSVAAAVMIAAVRTLFKV